MALGYTYCIKRDYIEITLIKVLNFFFFKGIKKSIKKNSCSPTPKVCLCKHQLVSMKKRGYKMKSN